MKAFVVSEYAHPSKIHLTHNAPEPVQKPGSDELLIDVHSAGLNFFDILQCQGKYQTQPPRPFVLGAEFAGTVAAAPPGSPYKPGDRVFGAAQGAYGERVVAQRDYVLHLLDVLSFDQGAGIFMTYPTSYEALVGRAKLQTGEWLLVLAAAGGVGMAAVQIGKALGAHVIACASPSKLDVARSMGGADFVVDYTQDGWQKEVLKITGGRGVDVVFDPVGRIKDALKCVVWGGRALVVGFAGGEIEKLPLNLVLLKNVSVIGIYWGSYQKNKTTRVSEVWTELLALFASGRLKPVVFNGRYTLGTLTQGLQDLENRKTWGKVVVHVREPSARGKL
ncbi:NAD-P-binding protein [Russula ochroleuca]|jgi:NADPH:quinone reductase-like Zn-dependent oxidoreductase|uniref:NAD-P-binding protein n=1 Tax=Russula ochroleuca TaxID=152965 RepID=A0A9P5TDD6_9AGAM|nr:NAD-P-binding protein [Russula ochroleuca]